MDHELSEQIKKQVLLLLTKEAVELVDLSISRGRRRSVIRLLVDKPGGITLDECARLNQEIGRLIERENIIQESYVLEVSSPGLDRPMESTRDFQRCLGQLVKIVLRKPLNRQNVWVGVMEAVDKANVVIRTEEAQMLRIAREDITRARLEVRP
ncbi:MAG: ribosome maturation factor RimP [Candidatus Omnitrophica bacterium]|nr:ribosome maturation factor RimP [Candidatus Omnitrophota bacterium]MBU4140896.1 ribosome maturation factor RimP [Candidatus Omnitrophota bacterium]